MAAGVNRFIFSEGAVTLNDEQARIVRQAPDQNLRILASAGSGKTTTLTTRIAHLLTHCDAKPEQIVLLTFTHNAATVMKGRLENLVGPKRILCGTFHALSQQILRDHQPDALSDLYHVDELPLKALDFLASAEGKAWARTVKWIFIDEYQDINDTQYNFIRALHHPGATVTIVGDDAQNIYSWRGSCVDYILNFHKRFPEVADFQLSTNYRSSAAIVAIANSIMRYIPTLPYKELMCPSPTAEQGARPEVLFFARTAEERDHITEAAVKAVATGTTVILSKFNSVLYTYEAALMRMGVRVRFVQGEESLHQKPGAPPTVFLSTFHGSKGLEWDHVFLVRMNDEVFPQQKDEDSVLQERRLFYVAVTRARRTLTISYSRNSKSLSRFVREVHRPLLQWRGLPQFELSTLSSAITPVSVSEWVNYLSGEDYRTIKFLDVLPRSLRDLQAIGQQQQQQPQPQSTTNPTAWVTPYWWVEQGMASEFFDFLRAYWQRELGVSRPESGGFWDRDAQQLIWTIKIAAEDAAVFETHRDLIEMLAHRFFGATPPGDAPPHIYYTEVIAAMGAAATKLEQTELIRIIQIVHKMRTVLYNLRQAHITLADFRFAPIRHAPPQESRCELIEAWRSYTSGVKLTQPQPSRDELGAIYKIGLCRALGEGRSGVLMSLPGEREWSRCRDFLSMFHDKIHAVLDAAKGQPILCRVIADLVDGVKAEADMLVGETAWFFVSGDNPTELQRLDRMLTILLTVHALRLAGHRVTRVCLFQLITGLSLDWSVEAWQPKSAALLTAFVQARVQHVASSEG
jgi:hypothetical protein